MKYTKKIHSVIVYVCLIHSDTQSAFVQASEGGAALNDEFIPSTLPLSEERAGAAAKKNPAGRYSSEADPLLSSSSSSGSI